MEGWKIEATQTVLAQVSDSNRRNFKEGSCRLTWTFFVFWSGKSLDFQKERKRELSPYGSDVGRKKDRLIGTAPSGVEWVILGFYGYLAIILMG